MDSLITSKNRQGWRQPSDFFDQLMSSFEALAQMPRMGVLCGFRKPAIRRLRRWPVKEFENWLIFYQARRDGVDRPCLARGP